MLLRCVAHQLGAYLGWHTDDKPARETAVA